MNELSTDVAYSKKSALYTQHFNTNFIVPAQTVADKAVEMFQLAGQHSSDCYPCTYRDSSASVLLVKFEASLYSSKDNTHLDSLPHNH